MHSLALIFNKAKAPRKQSSIKVWAIRQGKIALAYAATTTTRLKRRVYLWIITPTRIKFWRSSPLIPLIGAPVLRLSLQASLSSCCVHNLFASLIHVANTFARIQRSALVCAWTFKISLVRFPIRIVEFDRLWDRILFCPLIKSLLYFDIFCLFFIWINWKIALKQ